MGIKVAGLISRKNSIKEISVYIGAIALCLLILAWVMELWNADLSIPLSYSRDALDSAMVIKGLIDNGWFLHNEFVGMPSGLDLHDYPYQLTSNFHFLLIKLVSLFVSDYAVTMNLYYLLTFPLTTITSLFVFRQFNISYAFSVVGSLLFTFLPYHIMRGEDHLMLASYYMIPLIILVILWIYSKKSILFQYDEDSRNLRLDLISFESLLSIIICLIISSTEVYFAFFACFFLIIAGISASFTQKNIYRLMVSGILIALISIVILVNISPNLIYRYNHGYNTEAVQRYPEESEIYGMKISQLLLPVSRHRISFLANLKHKYNAHAPLVNENNMSTLGMIGSFGFLILIGWLFYGRLESRHKELDDDLSEVISRLSVLNISAVLLATIGGFGSLFANLIPEIRSYNRISIYIAFFSLFTVVLLLDRFSQMYRKSTPSRFIVYAFLSILLLLGILDQSAKDFAPNYALLKWEYTSDAEFVSKIEASVPHNAMIFQLPYLPYPEQWRPVHKLTDYELFKGYLHSKTLRWSYGAMRGREGDIWQREVAKKPPEALVETLSFAGFSGIYLDRHGYADMGNDLETKISALLNTKPIVSANNRLVFFNMTGYNQKVKAKYTDEEWVSIQYAVLHPLIQLWEKGFSLFEGKPEDNWRWCSSEGLLRIINTSKQERKVRVEMAFATGYEEFSNLLIDSRLFSENLKINNKAKLFTKEITIPPGKHDIKFLSDAKRVDALPDTRFLVFRVINFSLKVIK